VAEQVQADLAQQGYHPGPIDGVVGSRTGAAIAAYQRDNGLPVTGTIDGALLQSLGVE
jgi:peptidoglycan hydrolase-like protein with peptidoglycan-binding domain